jgi:hypothetical protein
VRPARLFDREWHFLRQKKGRLTLTQMERVIPLIFASFLAALTLTAWSLICPAR